MIELIEEIRDAAKGMEPIRIMEVCGGHTNVVMKYGIRAELPKNVELISGPGCPVCVTSQGDIDSVVKLAIDGVPIATYGDMLRVPGSEMSLEQAREQGAKVKMVLSVEEVPKEYVFFGIGFETTTPMTAYLLERGIRVFSSHKVMPPPMKILTEETKIDGYMAPGHVSTIIGADAYKGIDVPIVVSGFKPELILTSILKLVKMIKNKENRVENNYPEVVRPNGNVAAKKLIEEQFELVNGTWRGLGELKGSALEVRNPELNAKEIYADNFSGVESEEPKGCRCGEILKGLVSPKDCPLFKKECTPESPKGACMVSEEGTCNIWHRYHG